MARSTLSFVAKVTWAMASASPLAAQAAPTPLRAAHAALETSAGDPVDLTALLTKPTVIFYEDRDSTKLNQHVKDALFERGKALGLLNSAAVIAIANVKEWNWFPARNFVLKAVRDIEAKVHIPIYLDFSGDMTAPPWSLPSKSSTVLVLNANTEPVLLLKGRLNAGEVEKLFSTLAEVVTPPAAKP